MERYKLPVLVLKDLILLPKNEQRLELDSYFDKEIVDVALKHKDGKIFIVTQKNTLEEAPDIVDIPSIGVLAEITSKIELPNGKTRILLKGITRAISSEYTSCNTSVLTSSIEVLNEEASDEKLDGAIVRKLRKELDIYIKLVPTISNSIITQIESAQNLSEITDIIVNYLPLTLERKRAYLECFKAMKRAEMILEDIYQEEALYEIEKRLDSKVKNVLEENQKNYILREKIKVMKEEIGESTLHDDEVKQLRAKLDELVCSEMVREKILFEINRYELSTPSSPELGLIRNYIDCLLSLPWDKSTKDMIDLKSVKNKLDLSHYGLDNVKNRIVEYLAVKIHSKSLNSPIICLVGPPGTGKTTLAYSIARSMKRNFVKISVGGVTDEAEILGHRKSYLGASPGRIIEGMRKAKSNNPVFLIDEVDKISTSSKGNPTSALLEVLDTEQNKSFRDNYLEVEYDLSNVMFILTANSTDTIPTPLLDRLEIIDIEGYTEYEKQDIAKKYLIPKLCKSHGLDYLKVYDKVILEIIEHYTKESGVRELERQLSKVIRKIVTELVTKHNLKERPVLSIDNLEMYLGKKKFYNLNSNVDYQVGVVSALSYTPYGGDVLPIEVNYYKGSGKLILTGSLGDVMKESATLALSYIKSNCEKFGISYQLLCENDIHVHIPTGAIAKDGPSAGVTLVTSIISAFANIKMDNRLAMTGEITLRGNILPVGGLREKCLGAIRNNIKRIFIPRANIRDIEELPNDITEKLVFIPVGNYMEIFDEIKKERYT